MSCKQPIILLIAHPPTEKIPYYYVYPDYLVSLRNAGASAYVVTPGEKKECIENVYSNVDGILFTGGGDIDPVYYDGSNEHENIYGINNERDETEIALAELALKKNEKPILAICRGLQLINVVLGGTLYEDIELTHDQEHRKSEIEGVKHNIYLNNNTNLQKALKINEMEVISWHHQSINKLGKGMVTVAKAEDKTVEACEIPGHAWFLGVQWHPEMSYSQDLNQKKIFQMFVDACK